MKGGDTVIYNVARRIRETDVISNQQFSSYRAALTTAASLVRDGFGYVSLDKHNNLTGRCEPMAEWLHGKRVTPSFEYVGCAHKGATL